MRQARHAAMPFLLRAGMPWFGWRVLLILRDMLVPARIREVRRFGDGGATVLLLDTQEPDGGTGRAMVEAPASARFAPGQRVTLWRGQGLSLARCGHATLSAAVMAGVAVVWLLFVLMPGG